MTSFPPLQSMSPSPSFLSEGVTPPYLPASPPAAISSVRDIVFSPKTRQFPPSISAKKRREISQLKFSSQQKAMLEESTRKAKSADQFFGRWNVQGTAFSQADVDELYRMMSAHPMSHGISFYSLFGMEFCSLLEELKSLEKLKFLSSENLSSCMRLWHDKYVECYSNLLNLAGTKPVPIFVLKGSIKVNTIEGFYLGMQKILTSELAQKKAQAASPKIQAFHQRRYDEQVSPFLARWNRTRQLFEKFLVSPQAFVLLYEAKLTKCCGVRKAMPLSTLSDVRIVGKNFYKYAAFLKQCIDDVEPAIPTEVKAMFGSLLTRMKPLMFDEPTSPREMTALCEDLYGRVTGYIDDLILLENRADTLSMRGQLRCCGAWMCDFLNVLETTILSVTNPLHHIRRLHETRALLNLGIMIDKCVVWSLKEYEFNASATAHEVKVKFDAADIDNPENRVEGIQEMFATQLPERVHESLLDAWVQVSMHSRWNDETCPPTLRSIYQEFLIALANLYTFSTIQQKEQEIKSSPDKEVYLKNEELIDLCAAIGNYAGRGIRPSLVMRESLEQISRKFKVLTNDTLRNLSQYANEHPNEMRGLPLLEMTEDLARMLILVHDLDIVLYGQSEWSCELPSEYLQLLALEQDTEASSTFSGSEEEAPAELPVSSTGNLLEDSEISTPPASVKKQEGTPSAALKSCETLPAKERLSRPKEPVTVRNIGLKKGMQARQVARVLEKLGLVAIEGARHTKLEDAQGRLVTVVPRHGTLSAGVLHAIQEQVDQKMKTLQETAEPLQSTSSKKSRRRKSRLNFPL